MWNCISGDMVGISALCQLNGSCGWRKYDRYSVISVNGTINFYYWNKALNAFYEEMEDLVWLRMLKKSFLNLFFENSILDCTKVEWWQEKQLSIHPSLGRPLYYVLYNYCYCYYNDCYFYCCCHTLSPCTRQNSPETAWLIWPTRLFSTLFLGKKNPEGGRLSLSLPPVLSCSFVCYDRSRSAFLWWERRRDCIWRQTLTERQRGRETERDGERRREREGVSRSDKASAIPSVTPHSSGNN